MVLYSTRSAPIWKDNVNGEEHQYAGRGSKVYISIFLYIRVVHVLSVSYECDYDRNDI